MSNEEEANESERMRLAERAIAHRAEVMPLLRQLAPQAADSDLASACGEVVGAIMSYELSSEMSKEEPLETKLKDLRRERLWELIQSRPSRVKFPSGESFVAAERRIKRGLNKVARANQSGKVLVVSHGDPIKIAMQLALKGDLDSFQRIVIDPGSVTIIDWPNGTLIASNIPAKLLATTSRAKSTRKNVEEKLSNRRVLGGGTNVSSRI